MKPLPEWLLLIVLCFSINSFSAPIPAPVSVHKSHGLSRFDDLKYPLNFSHFDYVNPNAPKGGEIKTAGVGTFESVNPYTRTGLTPLDIFPYGPLGMGYFILNEPLMAGTGSYAPTGDEPRSAYGLIAESVEYPDDNRWIIFNLRPEARFHDDHPITSEDVLFTFNTLKSQGHIKFKRQLEPVIHAEALGKYKVRFNFVKPGPRSQLFAVAELPILPRHFWKDRDIGKSSMIPNLNSGPYQITQVKPSYSITLTRNKNYWGKNLPVNRGKYNLDKVTLYFHRDPTIALQSFKSGEYDVHFEMVGKNWALEYGFPDIKNGLVKKTEIPTKLIIGSPMLVFNTRRDHLKDIRVREALGYMFDFEWTNKHLFYDAYLRSHSYFPNSVYAHSGTPNQQELALLTPWKQKLPDHLFSETFSPPISKGDGNIRAQNHKALELLKQAGWHWENEQLVNKEGKPFTIEILSYNHTFDRTYNPLIKNMTHLGISVTYQVVDLGVYTQRLRKLDFDMTAHAEPFGLSIGNELIRYFHSSQADGKDSKNLAGIKNPVVDALVEQLPLVKSQQKLETLAHALDRVLLWNHYGIPLWYYGNVRLAYRDIYQWPEATPAFPMIFNTWWIKENKAAKVDATSR